MDDVTNASGAVDELADLLKLEGVGTSAIITAFFVSAFRCAVETHGAAEGLRVLEQLMAEARADIHSGRITDSGPVMVN